MISKFRMVRADLCDKLAALEGPLKEMGASEAAALVAAVGLSPQCPMPMWPDSIYVLDRIRDRMIDFRNYLDDEHGKLTELTEATDKKSEPFVTIEDAENG